MLSHQSGHHHLVYSLHFILCICCRSPSINVKRLLQLAPRLKSCKNRCSRDAKNCEAACKPTHKPTKPITCANILCAPCFYCKNAQCLPSKSGTNCDLNSQPGICDGKGTCVAKPTKPTCATIRCAPCFYCKNGRCLRSMRGNYGLRG